MAQIFKVLSDALQRSEPVALGIITRIKGSSPQKCGAKALFFSDGRIVGTVGGGCLEAEIQSRALQALTTQTPIQFELVLDHDFGWDDGLICGGQVSGIILPNPAYASALWTRLSERAEKTVWGIREDFTVSQVEIFTPEWIYQEEVIPRCALWIAGAGHVSQSVASLADSLDFQVTVFDDRPTLASSHFFPQETVLRVDYWEKLVQETLPARSTFGLILTRGHQHDAFVLRHWIHQPFAYLGMIGSLRKKRLIFDGILDQRLATETELAQVVCPVGFDILAHSVPEIAISIMAQLVQFRGERILNRKSKSSIPPVHPLCAPAA